MLAFICIFPFWGFASPPFQVITNRYIKGIWKMQIAIDFLLNVYIIKSTCIRYLRCHGERIVKVHWRLLEQFIHLAKHPAYSETLPYWNGLLLSSHCLNLVINILKWNLVPRSRRWVLPPLLWKSAQVCKKENLPWFPNSLSNHKCHCPVQIKAAFVNLWNF